MTTYSAIIDGRDSLEQVFNNSSFKNFEILTILL